MDTVQLNRSAEAPQGVRQDGDIVRYIPVEALNTYCTSKAVIANDIAGASGGILVSRGTLLVNLTSSIAGLQKQLANSGVEKVPLLFPGESAREELQSFIRGVEPGMMPLEPELAHQTATRVTDVLEHIKDGDYSEEDVREIADSGKALAKRIAGAPQLMFCLGQVRNWDEYTSVHSMNVALMAGFLAERMFPGNTELAEFMTVGGILHDLGKAKIPLEILNKPDKLTENEFLIMKQHPLLGVELATSSGVTDPRAIDVIQNHHEQYNGEGYPFGEKGDALSIESKIAAVADVFDALTAKRVYKEPVQGREAISIMTGAMAPHFDPAVIRVLMLCVGIYPAGSMVELSDGSIGVVLGTEGRNLLYPKVLLRYAKNGRMINERQVIQTGTETGLMIKRSVRTGDKLGF